MGFKLEKPDLNKIKNNIVDCVKKNPLYDEKNDSLEVEIMTIRRGLSIEVTYIKEQFSPYDPKKDIKGDTHWENKEGDMLYTGFEIFFYPYLGTIDGQLNVHPDYRRQGLGRKLFELLKEIAKSIDIKKSRVLHANEEFFKNLGYEVKIDEETEEPCVDISLE